MAKDKSIEVPAPRENPRLFGHEIAEQQFLQEFAGGKTHHAYLMTGPKGIGKATLAYRFARHILATGAVQAKKQAEDSFSLFGDATAPAKPAAASLDTTPDDALFRRIAAGSHTDLLTIAPAYDKKKDVEKNIIGVEEARKVPEFLSLTPAEGDWRVVIVDAVDQLNSNAANALLKILEEPPAQAILLLVCHEPGGILPTIKSRCRKFALSAPSRAAFDAALAAVAPAIDSSDYAALHALSNGSPGLAITLYAQDGIKLYQQWLGALQPDASPATRQRFADTGAAQKTPDAWRTLMHGWQTAISRISLWPHTLGSPIIAGEGELIGAIAQNISNEERAQWAGRAARLIGATDTFNLDKRQSIAMLLEPGLLDRLAA
jgi:DNA polymerase-3 subunit delta'